MEQTAQRLTKEGLTNWKAVQLLLLNVLLLKAVQTSCLYDFMLFVILVLK